MLATDGARDVRDVLDASSAPVAVSFRLAPGNLSATSLPCGDRRRRTPAHAGMDFEYHPPITIPVPGPPHIIAAPIFRSAEDNDGNTKDRGSCIRQEYDLAAVIKAKIFAEDPPAVSLPDDVAPRFRR